MPIKWSALKESETMDMVEEFVNKAANPLECAKIAASEASRILGLPQYLEERLSISSTHLECIGYIRDDIKAVRESLLKRRLKLRRKPPSSAANSQSQS